MADPLALRISCKPQFALGEGVVVQIAHEIFGALEMETVELNQARTHVHLSRVDADTRAERVFTGIDYARWHQHPLLAGIGSSFKAVRGGAWETPLQLLHFGPALPIGEYSLFITYQFGEAEAQTVRSNQIDFEVVPIELGSARFRWFAEKGVRGELGALWTAVGPEGPLWFFQTASPKHPAVLRTSASLAPVDFAAVEAPRLCHLNDIHAFHFERYAAWLDDAGLCFLAVHAGGRNAQPLHIAHSLRAEPPPSLVDPPLQLRTGGLAAVLVGARADGAPAAALLAVDAAGKVSERVVPLPRIAERTQAIAWSNEEFGNAPVLYCIEPSAHGPLLARLELEAGAHAALAQLSGEVDGLVIDQWQGEGCVLVLCHEGGAGRRALWSAPLGAGATARREDWGPAELELPRASPIQLAAFPAGSDLAALFRTSDAWLVVTRTASWKAPLAESFGSVPSLIVTGAGKVFFVVWQPGVGFVARDVALGDGAPA